jgi:hypothetical protein
MGEGSGLGCRAPGGGAAVIKRPLAEQFHQKVVDGIKISTIRPNPWPLRVPIQLFRWEDKPYRSKHVNGPIVVVNCIRPMQISNDSTNKPQYCYRHGSFLDVVPKNLCTIEGFNSQEDMDTWFRRLVKPGQTIQSYQMLFSLIKP